MGRHGLRKNRAHRQHDKSRDQHQLVGNWVEDGSELRFLVETTRQQAVQTVGHSGGLPKAAKQVRNVDRKSSETKTGVKTIRNTVRRLGRVTMREDIRGLN